MGKELAAIIIGIGVEIIVTIFGVVVKVMPMPFAIAGGIIGFGLIVFGLISLISSGRMKLASQIYDIDMGGHLNQIEKMLKLWKKQLLSRSKSSKLLSDLRTEIEKKRGFYQVLEHCPRIHKKYEDLRLSRVLYEAKVKSKSVTSEDDEWLKGRMKALAEAINNCLSDSEYLDHTCSICIKKNKKLNGPSKNHKSAIGGLLGRQHGGKVSNSYFKGKITIHGKPEEVDVGGLIGQGENTEVVDSSADAEIEYKQD